MSMEFKKYQHLERFGTSEVEGIEIGICYIFPKIDGTNASVWWDNRLQAGSRNRQLSIDEDNAGFCAWANSNIGLQELLKENQDLRLYGEWLVPHSLKTYRENAWRDFYVFDVMDGDRYLPYEEYVDILKDYSVNYIPPLKIIKNASYDDFVFQMSQNTFLIEDGKGVGEGVVIKNYDFTNKYGRTVWAKVISSEFKEKHNKTMGAPNVVKADLIEQKIAEKYVTQALCDKVLAKIENESGFSSKNIPQLLNRVYYDVVKEECWNFVKENKNPTINFKTLFHFVSKEVKVKLNRLF